MLITTWLLLLQSLTILSSSCTPKALSISGFSEKIRRSKKTLLKLVFQPCPSSKPVSYEWQFFRRHFELSSSDPLQAVHYFESETLQTTVDGYKLHLHSDSVYESWFFVRASVGYSTTKRTYIEKRFKFIPDAIYLNIYGGTTREVPSDQLLTLNGELSSKDASFKPGENPWLSGQNTWSVLPPLNMVTPSSMTWVIPIHLLTPNVKYVFQLVYKRGSLKFYPAEANSTQSITVSDHKNEAYIKCVLNCFPPKINSPTTAAVITREGVFSLQWDLNPVPPDLNEIEVHSSFGITFNEDIFPPGHQITLLAKTQHPSMNTFTSLSLRLQFEGGPPDGTCSVFPASGTSGVTLFNFTCDGFGDDNLYILFQHTSLIPGRLGIPLSYQSNPKSETFYLLEASITFLIVKDESVTKTINQTINVQPFSSSLDPSQLIPVTKEIVFGTGATSIQKYLEGNDFSKAVQMSCVIAKLLPNFDLELSQHLQKHLVEMLIESISPPLIQVIQSVIALEAVLKVCDLDPDVAALGSIGLKTISETLNFVVLEERETERRTGIVKSVFRNALHLASAIVGPSKTQLDILNETYADDDYPVEVDMNPKKVNLKFQQQIVVKNVFESVDRIASAFVELFPAPGKKLRKFTSDKFTVWLSKCDKESFVRIELPFIVIPMEFWTNLPASSNFRLQIWEVKPNPFWWGDDFGDIKTNITVVSLRNENNDLVTASSSPLELIFKMDGGSLNKTLSGSIKPKEVVAYRVYVDKESIFTLKFQKPTEDFVVLLTSKCYPVDFEEGNVILANGSEKERIIQKHVEGGSDLYVGLTAKRGISFEATVEFYRCLVWDMVFMKWVIGCEVHPNSTYQELRCVCHHFSIFTGGFLVPPNEISIDKIVDFELQLTSNPLVVITVGVILVVYLILLLGGWWLDRKHRLNIFVWPLDDNVPGDEFAYLLVVFTGTGCDAGTTGRVAVEVRGLDATSRVHLLTTSPKQALDRGENRWFLMFTPNNLGEIQSIRLWHDCEGLYPHWYCERIVIEDIQTKKRYYFIVQKWFSLVWGDGEIERIIDKTPDDKLTDAMMVFPIQLHSNFRNGHLLLSVFWREPQSIFTSAERVTCVFVSILTTMLASAMFFGIPRNVPADQIDEQPDFFISFRTVVIVIESLLITLPLNLLIVYLFNKS